MQYVLAGLAAVFALATAVCFGWKLRGWSAAFCSECGKPMPVVHSACLTQAHQRRSDRRPADRMLAVAPPGSGS